MYSLLLQLSYRLILPGFTSFSMAEVVSETQKSDLG